MTLPRTISGAVASGQGRGADFTMLAWVRSALVEAFGIEPHPGTLNLQLREAADLWVWARARQGMATRLRPPDPGHCEAHCYPVWIGHGLPGVVVQPLVPGYPPDRLELVGPIGFRDRLDLADGDPLQVEFATTPVLDTIIFDVDGTLVDSLDGYRLAASRAAGNAGYPVTLETVRAALNGEGSFWDLVLTGHPDHNQARVEELRARTWDYWPQVLRERVRLPAGVADMVTRLQRAGIRLAIYTGSAGESMLPLREAGLLDAFECVLTGRDVRRPKPDPEGLCRCLERLGANPDRVAYVGDTVPDMQAARAAGLTAIGVLGGAADSARLALAGARWLLPGARALPVLLGLQEAVD